MYLDELLEFADATDVSGSAGTAVVGDVIDLGAVTGQDIGIGEPLWVVIQTTTEIITGGSAGTMQFFVVSDSLATLGAATVASCTTHLQTTALVTDDAGNNDDAFNVGGVIMAAQLPAGTYERYLGILATIATETVTAGAVNAFITPDYQKYVNYPNAI